ncbi:MAG TPA: hypothetical protein DCY20_10740 [Firmicutes bacterium]|nr:hypothetical protein [Bacillota bacterium]
MKKTYTLCTCLLISLSLMGCSNTDQTASKTISTPQTLESLNLTTQVPSTNDTDTNTDEDTDSTINPTPVVDNADDEETLPDLSTQALFVEYMNTQIVALESLYAQITNNITLTSQTTDETLKAQYETIQTNLFNELSETWNTLYTVTTPNEDVVALKNYMCDAYYYSIEDGKLQSEIVAATTDTERTSKQEESDQMTYKRTEAIALAKDEISKLSELDYYSK